MNTPNEQTLRPVSKVAEIVFQEIWHGVPTQKGIRQTVVDTLTTDRDHAYTLLKEAIAKKKKPEPDEPDEMADQRRWDAWEKLTDDIALHNDAIDDILQLLDTIYGKTHTV